MSLLKYLTNRNSLPDPRGELSSPISSRAIAQANYEVQAELAGGTTENGRKKRGHYLRYGNLTSGIFVARFRA